MARVQYTFTFTNAQAGAVVNFGDVPVFSSATDATPDGPRLALDSGNTVSVWSDAATLTAMTRDGRGEAITATATRANPSVTDSDGNVPTGGPFLRQSDAAGAYTTVVFHNATAGTARPTGAAHVIWIGTVTPTNPITDDEFIDKSTSPATFKRYTGSAFEAIGGGGGGSGVSSFNTRTGAVTLAKTDVTGTGLAASDVSAAPAQESVNVVTTAGAAQTLPDPVTAQSMNRLTLTATCALTFPSLGAGKSFTLSLIQDATGARTVTWPGTVLWPNNTPPILTTTPGKRDTFVFWSETGSNWSGATVGLSY